MSTVTSLSSELPNLAAARSEALRLAREILEKEASSGERLTEYRFVNIRDETGKVILRVPFDDALNG
jgi:hypothetical protein